VFAREGAKVLLVDRDPELARETLEVIEGAGGIASIFEADVSKIGDCEALVEAAVDRYGGLDILFNNVAILSLGSVVDADEQEWDRIMQVNVKSMMLTSKFAVPSMSGTGGGSIINVSSVEAFRGGANQLIAYSVSKGAIVTLTTSMAVQHGRENVRVNGIVPGYLYTPLISGFMSEEEREEIRDRRRNSAPLGVEGNAWDIAWAAVFLASEESRWVTGVMLPVDAGVLATMPPAMLEHLK
jgi:NAD(P)-dependent dehydrogenase (short-subunit alcohol dehydrogenase family)